MKRSRVEQSACETSLPTKEPSPATALQQHSCRRGRFSSWVVAATTTVVTLWIVLPGASAWTHSPQRCNHPHQQQSSHQQPSVRAERTVLFDMERTSELMQESEAALKQQQQWNESLATMLEEQDQPMPTVNGGFTHTQLSKAKISAANKGRTPWNKGKMRSEETRAKIAAGVRARNRARFLDRLKEMNITEAEYTERKAAERRKKDAERRSRRTAKGGYRPTEETKQKISRVLKEKFAKGEIKPRRVDPTKVRRGFTHSQETKEKIAASLRKRWANDTDYRAKMLEKTVVGNSSQETRQKISATLRKKWADPDFRATMLAKISTRNSKPGPHDEAHREKISAAMKAKWQDATYRQKTLESIAKRKKAAAKLKHAAQEKAQESQDNSSV